MDYETRDPPARQAELDALMRMLIWAEDRLRDAGSASAASDVALAVAKIRIDQPG